MCFISFSRYTSGLPPFQRSLACRSHLLSIVDSRYSRLSFHITKRRRQSLLTHRFPHQQHEVACPLRFCPCSTCCGTVCTQSHHCADWRYGSPSWGGYYNHLDADNPRNGHARTPLWFSQRSFYRDNDCRLVKLHPVVECYETDTLKQLRFRILALSHGHRMRVLSLAVITQLRS